MIAFFLAAIDVLVLVAGATIWALRWRRAERVGIDEPVPPDNRARGSRLRRTARSGRLVMVRARPERRGTTRRQPSKPQPPSCLEQLHSSPTDI